MIDLRDESSAKVGEKFAELTKRLREGKRKQPIEKFLIIFLFAGHGILKDGLQALLFNEYDEKTGFYRLLTAEAKLRLWSEIYPKNPIFPC